MVSSVAFLVITCSDTKPQQRRFQKNGAFRTIDQVLMKVFGGSLANQMNASRKVFCN